MKKLEQWLNHQWEKFTGIDELKERINQLSCDESDAQERADRNFKLMMKLRCDLHKFTTENRQLQNKLFFLERNFALKLIELTK